MCRDEVAVLIPCYNEEITIGKVVDDFKREIPEATIYVYDNNSTDKTSAIAKEHGAVLRTEKKQGKGNVVRTMFNDIDAEVYVMVDGDDTYPAESVRDLVDPITAGEADMVVGDRISNGSYGSENKRAFHNFGNNLVCFLIKSIYGYKYSDVMTGYRAFSRDFVENFPVLSEGFQIETELSIHAVDKRLNIENVPIDYRDRPEGSYSKLSTIKDGVNVIMTIEALFRDYKPMAFFGIVAIILGLISLILFIPVFIEYLQTGLVPKIPTLVVAIFFGIASLLSFTTGIILDSIARNNRRVWEITRKRSRKF